MRSSSRSRGPQRREDGSSKRPPVFYCSLSLLIVRSKSNKTLECARSLSFRHSHLFRGPRDAFLLQLDILPSSHRRSVAQETGLRKVSQIQTVFVVWHNVLAVGKQVLQSHVHLHLSSPSDIRAQTERRLRPSRTSSQCDHRPNTPGSSHRYAKRKGKSEGRQLRVRRDASKACRIPTVTNRRLLLFPKPMSLTSHKSPLTTPAGSRAYLASVAH